MDIEVDIWRWNPEFLEKRVRHILIKVLSCMDESIYNCINVFLKFSNDRCDLHEVRTSSGDDEDFYHSVSV